MATPAGTDVKGSAIIDQKKSQNLSMLTPCFLHSPTEQSRTSHFAFLSFSFIIQKSKKTVMLIPEMTGKLKYEFKGYSVKHTIQMLFISTWMDYV